MIKKVIVLGAGQGQVSLLLSLKKMGAYVISVAPLRENSPCFALADKIYYEDVKNKNAILNIAKNEGVQAVLTDQLDIASQTCGYVTEQLNLIGNSYFCSQLFSNKKLMHDYANKIGVKTAQNCKVHYLDEAIDFSKKNLYPLIIKPVDCDGSRGIHKIYSQNELCNAFKDAQNYSSDHSVFIEEFISGQEYVVDGFAWDGHYQTLAIGKCYNFDIYGKCISKQRIFKSAASELSDIEKRIIKINQDIVKLYSPRVASTQGEYIYDVNRDEIYFNEIAARGGGCFVSSHLVPYACGINVNDVLAQYVLGYSNKFVFNLYSGFSAYTCFLLPKGTIVSITGKDKLVGIPSLKNMFIDNLHEGQIIPEIKDKSSRFGPFITASKNQDQMFADIDVIKSNFEITICGTNDKMTGIIW